MNYCNIFLIVVNVSASVYETNLKKTKKQKNIKKNSIREALVTVTFMSNPSFVHPPQSLTMRHERRSIFTESLGKELIENRLRRPRRGP